MRKKFFWVIVGILCIFLACLSVNYDYDLFARLIVGERFIENGILPFKDFLSYTPTHPWYDHEWGSGVIFYLILKYFGVLGFVLFEALAILGTTYFVVKTQRLQKHSYPTSLIFVTFFCYFFYKLNASPIRCHLFSFFFFSFFLYIMEKERKNPTKLLWTIPIITVFWNNVHGGVVSGLGLIFMYIIGNFLDKKPWKRLLAVLSISAPLLIINPYGCKYLKFLISATTKHRKYITEWWPFYARKHILYYLPSSIYVIFCILLNIYNSIKSKNINYAKWIVLLVTGIYGLMHVKLLSLSIIAASALFYNELFKLFIPLKKYLKTIEKSLYAVIILLGITIPFFKPWVPVTDFYKFPLYEVEFLKINNIKGNIVVPFGLGSYVSYKLYPDNLIYMDGRYEEVYDDKIFEHLKKYELADNNWRDIYQKYDTDILMPRKTSDIYEILRNDKDWELIFEGRLCGIFVKKGRDLFSYYEPEYGLGYYKRTMFKSVTMGKKLKK